jgi:hypothetical protein
LLLSNFALEYTIRKAQQNKEWSKLSGVCQLLCYANCVNLLGENVNTVKKETESLLVTGMEVDLEINAEEIKNVILSCNWVAGQSIL